MKRSRRRREARAATGDELQGSLERIIVRLMKMLTRQASVKRMRARCEPGNGAVVRFDIANVPSRFASVAWKNGNKGDSL
jgi:hypothetical protein